MTKPTNALLWIGLFLAAVAALGVAMVGPIAQFFGANPVFNGVIFGVLLIGVAVNLRQIILLGREVSWIENFRRSDPTRPQTQKPKLLAPLAKLLSGRERGSFSLSTSSLRSLLDSVYLRLEESRDLSRYLIGLSIFLGLLGTFWGLLVTIGSVAEIIGGLSVGSDVVAMFEQLKTNLKTPLNGMATSFSTSLFGLGGSLILGFLDLQSGHVQNRFYNELEEWLSGMTKLASSSLPGDGEAAVPAYVQALLEQTADGLERMQRAIVDSDRDRRGGAEQLAELTTQIGRLNDLLTRESRELKQLAETQVELKNVLKAAGNGEHPGARLSEDLRSELRLLSRTIAAAMDGRREIN